MPWFPCCPRKGRLAITKKMPSASYDIDAADIKTKDTNVNENSLEFLKKQVLTLKKTLNAVRDKLEESRLLCSTLTEESVVAKQNIYVLKQRLTHTTEYLDRQKSEMKEQLETKDKRIEELNFKMRALIPPQEEVHKRRRSAVVGTKITFDNDPVKTEKSAENRKFLIKAIRSNDLLKQLSEGKIMEMVDYMKPMGFPQNNVVIKEGTSGDKLYVLQTGECEVTKEGKQIAVLNEGRVFGELAILYNCKRIATIRALQTIKVWYLERQIYQYIMIKVAKSQISELKRLVKDTPLKHLSPHKFGKIADAVQEEEYEKGAYIVRQGEIGKTFYIIKEGEVAVTQIQETTSNREEKFLRCLEKGNFFGEKALQNNGDKRTASIIANSEKVVCLTLDKKHFDQLIGHTANIIWTVKSSLALHETTHQRLSSDSRLESKRPTPVISQKVVRKSLENLKLEELYKITVLGLGAFGKVELVSKRGWDKCYALKCIKKHYVVEKNEQEHVYSEKNSMMKCNSPFIVRMYKTFKNPKYVYMLMEACLGGEIWTRLREKRQFSDSCSRFYTACVVEALDYMHHRGIAHRDLKPENLLLNEKGYVKVADFGYAKEIEPGERTWTLCGTPHYMAPEIILNQGHGIAADYWALGILIFEFLTGDPPFNSKNDSEIYVMSLKGMGAVEFPKHVKASANDLIRRLCREKPTERIGNLKNGVTDIREHKWFTGFDWNGLRNGDLEPEYIPEVKSAYDTQNFEKFTDHNESVPIENSGWDKDF